MTNSEKKSMRPPAATKKQPAGVAWISEKAETLLILR